MTRRPLSFVSHPRGHSGPPGERENQSSQPLAQATPSRPVYARENEDPPDFGNSGPHDGLDALFAEVKALANELRKPTSPLRPDRGPATSGRNVLQILARHGPRTVPQVARQIKTSRQNVQVLVNRLQTQGLVEFTANPAHKRSDLVRLTASGQAQAAAVDEREVKLRENLPSGVSEVEVLSAAALLNMLREAVEGQLSASRPKTVERPKLDNETEARGRKRAAKIVAATAAQDRTEPGRSDAGESESTASELPVNLL